MATNTINFGGVTLPCTVERYPTIKKAARKYRQYSIPGRSGDIFIQDDAWENVIQPYEIYAGGDTDGQAQTDWTAIAKLLSLKDYQTLSDTYDTTHYRKAVFNGPMDIENAWNTHGRATIEFNCRPERFLTSGAESVTFEATDNAITIWKVSSLSSYLQSYYTERGITTEYVYAVTLPARIGRVFFRNLRDIGEKMLIMSISSGAEETATAVNSQYYYNITYWNHTGATAIDLLLPSVYFDGLPILESQDGVVNMAGAYQNDYMPAHPTIVLHGVASHSAEIVAARINGYGIYVNEYDASYPYIFIDTENWSVTRAASLAGDQFLANNVRMDAGIQLDEGENYIYTSSSYEIASFIPNLWEL